MEHVWLYFNLRQTSWPNFFLGFCIRSILIPKTGGSMALSRKVGFFVGLRYKGGGPMLAWILHRISGLGMVLFIGLHIVASHFSLDAGSDWAIDLNTLYRSVYFQLFIYFCVLYHGLNGLRIIILDLWPKMLEYQKEVTWLQWLIFVPIYGLTVFLMIQQLLLTE